MFVGELGDEESEQNYVEDADPLFQDANNGDFHLKEDSPCIGTDSNNTQMGAYGGDNGDW